MKGEGGGEELDYFFTIRITYLCFRLSSPLRFHPVLSCITHISLFSSLTEAFIILCFSKTITIIQLSRNYIGHKSSMRKNLYKRLQQHSLNRRFPTKYLIIMEKLTKYFITSTDYLTCRHRRIFVYPIILSQSRISVRKNSTLLLSQISNVFVKDFIFLAEVNPTSICPTPYLEA